MYRKEKIMRILYIKLTNFIGVYHAMGLHQVEFSFDDVTKPIIQIYGKNRCGKTVLLQQLHPFSSINLNGDERSDLSLIITGEVGIKNIVYEVNDKVYNITHTYKPTPSGNHTVSSSIMCNGEELNPSGGVTLFNTLIERLLGINKYVFQFIINGTNLLSFANMSTTQRKNLLNKAMGIDIYDKIHKMATDDYRYTSKLISSLNNAKEYLLSTYGSYETLLAMLNMKRSERDDLSRMIDTTKSRLNELSGTISVIRGQNVSVELNSVNNSLMMYENVMKEIGSFDDNLYENLINEQLALNNKINELRNNKNLLNRDFDDLCAKKNDIENTIMTNQKSMRDYNDMVAFRNDLENKIKSIEVSEYVESSSSYLMSMISLGQAINGICKEIVSSLNSNHLKTFAEMIVNGVDVSAFLIQEGSVLMDSEKEKSAVSRIRSMIDSVEGSYIDDCCHNECIYKRTHDMLDTYFKSYQSATSSKFTQYDIEQLDHAWKNVQTIKRLINMEIANEVRDLFDISNIVMNLTIGELGVNVKRIQYLMEEAGKIEQRNRYITQLSDADKTIENMKKTLLHDSGDMSSIISDLDNQINHIRSEISSIDGLINSTSNEISINDKRRMMLTQIKGINVSELKRRQTQLTSLSNQLISAENEYNTLNAEYNNMTTRMIVLSREVDSLESANTQYTNTLADIEKHVANDNKYKIIAEATSSTKGKPVLAIRETVENALLIANRLLDVMYDGEIRLLKPIINETEFSLPFRCGCNKSADIRYGSQSESTLLSLALSLSLSSSLTQYNVPLVDELDAYTDASFADSFVLMLSEIMSTLKMEQLFIISHKMLPGNYDHVVHVLDLSEEIEKQK